MTDFVRLVSSGSLGSVVLLALAGCGPGGPTRYEVSGKASFAGQPIPTGRIVFESQAGASASGVVGLAAVENGQYRTLPENGPVSGPQIVRICGYEGPNSVPKAMLVDYPQGRPIFQEYTTNVDLPKEPTTIDFDVPVSQK